MFWKLINLQKVLDELFDDSWCILAIPENCESIDAVFLIE